MGACFRRYYSGFTWLAWPMLDDIVFWKLLFMEEDMRPLFYMADCPKSSKSTIMFCWGLLPPPCVLAPPESMVCFMDAAGWVESPPALMVLDCTFLDSLRKACVFLDLSLIRLSSSDFSPFRFASMVIMPWILSMS